MYPVPTARKRTNDRPFERNCHGRDVATPVSAERVGWIYVPMRDERVRRRWKSENRAGEEGESQRALHGASLAASRVKPVCVSVQRDQLEDDPAVGDRRLPHRVPRLAAALGRAARVEDLEAR